MTKYILCMGQSNALGRTGTSNVYNAFTEVWDNTNDLTDTSNLGSAWIAPDYTAPPFVNSKGSFLTSAGAYMAKMVSPNEIHRMILVATGGQSIDAWINTSGVTGVMYARMVAVLAAAGVTSVDAVLWHQGENDEATYTTYEFRWDLLLAKLATDGYITSTTPIVIGECGAISSPNINTALHSIADADARIAIASIAGQKASDGVHFDNSMTTVIAKTYAKAVSGVAGFWESTWQEEAFLDKTYVYASTLGATLPNVTDTAVDLTYIYGNKNLIVNGEFVADRSGVWRFDLRGYTSANSQRVKLWDSNGLELDFVAYSGGADPSANNQFSSGFTMVRLWKGDAIRSVLQQGSGASLVLSDTVAQLFNRFSAEFMGED